jgi:hypothetical protein
MAGNTNHERQVTYSEVTYGLEKSAISEMDPPSTGDLRRWGALLTTGWACSSGSPDESAWQAHELTGPAIANAMECWS